MNPPTTAFPQSSTPRVTCPRCGQPGRPVKPVTLQSLLKPEARARAGTGPHRFCPTAPCEVVYFEETGTGIFTKSDLTVRVGLKETSAPRPVCYCFNHTVEEIEEQVRVTGRSTVPDDIKTRMKEACWCETRSPLGACCLATVTQFVQAAQARYTKRPTTTGRAAPPGAARQLEDRCAEQGAGPIASTGQPTPVRENCCAAHDAPAAGDAPAAAVPLADRVSKGELIAWLGSLGSAVMASACCWLPLLLLAFGVSGVAVSATFEKYRPLFAMLTFGFLAAAFYFAYRPRRKATAGAAGPDDAAGSTATATGACCPPAGGRQGRLQRFNRVMLWPVTALALALVFFPNYLGALLQGRPNQAFDPNLDQYIVTVEGMDCAACAAGLKRQLQAVPGVRAAQVDFSKKLAVIAVPKGAPAPKEAVLTAINEAGFTGRFQDRGP
jgi:copper chaperone CopZ